MALNAYMRLTGDTQGEIKGPVTKAGREDSIRVIAVNHEVIAPRDPASGLPTGKRQHKPLTITKELDRATPLLLNMLINNENISEMELRFWERSASKSKIQHYTIHLLNASIVGIELEMLSNKDPENMQVKEHEHVSFCYQKIIWTYEDGGITAEDDWEAPIA